jgi:hypothetical protein
VPRSTAARWLRRGPRAVVTLDVVTKDTIELQAEVIRLRQRNEVLSAIARLLFMLLFSPECAWTGPAFQTAPQSEDPGRNRPSADDSAARSGVARSRPFSFAVPRLESSRARLPTR